MRRPNRHRPLASAVGLAVLLAACTRQPPSDPAGGPSAAPSGPTLRVAFLRDGTDEAFLSRILPAEQGLRLALDEATRSGTVAAEVEVEPVDVGADPDDVARELAELTADPSVVGAVLGPGWRPPAEIVASLDGAGFATIALTPLGDLRPDGGPGVWRRMVAPLAAEGAALAARLRELPAAADGVCTAGDGDGAALVARSLRRGLRDLVGLHPLGGGPVELAEAVARTGCGALVWLGGAPGAAAVRLALVDAGLQEIALLGVDRVKDPSFVQTAAEAGEGAVVACPCADLSLSTRPGAQRFIHDFAESFGSAPGIFAVEGYDAGLLLARAIAAGGPTRLGVARSVAATRSSPGLGGTYRFGPDGELADPVAAIRLYRDEGGRWVPLPS